ncbi:MAG: hypothetical protein ACLQGP_36070 [Isosphaeraceae bacterium]
MLSGDFLQLGPRLVVNRRYIRSLSWRLEDGRYRLVTLSHGMVAKDEVIDAAKFEELDQDTTDGGAEAISPIA